MFDLLRTNTSTDSEDSTSEDSPARTNGFDKEASLKDMIAPAIKESATMMPPWESDFWYKYCNKLRVNGTVEGVCDLEEELPIG